MSAPLTIAVLEGDQTAQEMLEASLRALDPGVIGMPLELERFDLSLAHRRRTGNTVVEEAARAMRASGFARTPVHPALPRYGTRTPQSRGTQSG